MEMSKRMAESVGFRSCASRQRWKLTVNWTCQPTAYEAIFLTGTASSATTCTNMHAVTSLVP